MGCCQSENRVNDQSSANDDAHVKPIQMVASNDQQLQSDTTEDASKADIHGSSSQTSQQKYAAQMKWEDDQAYQIDQNQQQHMASGSSPLRKQLTEIRELDPMLEQSTAVTALAYDKKSAKGAASINNNNNQQLPLATISQSAINESEEEEEAQEVGEKDKKEAQSKNQEHNNEGTIEI